MESRYDIFINFDSNIFLHNFFLDFPSSKLPQFPLLPIFHQIRFEYIFGQFSIVQSSIIHALKSQIKRNKKGRKYSSSIFVHGESILLSISIRIYSWTIFHRPKFHSFLSYFLPIFHQIRIYSWTIFPSFKIPSSMLSDFK